MPHYEWTRSEPFRDHLNGRVISEGEIVELPEAVADPHIGFVESDDPDANPEGDTDESDDEVGLEDKDYSELREMAMEADTDEINGRSSKDEIVAYFADE